MGRSDNRDEETREAEEAKMNEKPDEHEFVKDKEMVNGKTWAETMNAASQGEEGSLGVEQSQEQSQTTLPERSLSQNASDAVESKQGTQKGKTNYKKQGPAKQSKLRMQEMLAKPGQLGDLALLYGLELKKITEAAASEIEGPEKKKAETEVATLQSIRRHLRAQRALIKFTGGGFLVPLDRIPCRLLAIEKKRIEALLRSKHRRARNYTDCSRGLIYRCPAPGCGGAAINLICAKTAITAHGNAHHRNVGIPLTYKVEPARGWHFCGYPSLQAQKEMSVLSFNALEDEKEGDSEYTTKENKQYEDMKESTIQGENRTKGLSTLKLSLVQGPRTASETNKMLYTTAENEEIMGAGVHVVLERGDETGATVKGIGKKSKAGKKEISNLGIGGYPALDGGDRAGVSAEFRL